MSDGTTIRSLEGSTWEDRFLLVAEMMEQAARVRILNPDDLVCNVLCNSCGRVAAATADHPPRGWRLGGFGEHDYCPDCWN